MSEACCCSLSFSRALILLLFSVVLLVEHEDLFNPRTHKLIARGRCFTPSPFDVVSAAYGVGPAIALGRTETHPIFTKRPLERLTVNTARIE